MISNLVNQDLFSLKDKVAVVTGGSRGIGEALAFGLAEFGAKVIRLGRSEEPEAEDRKNVLYQACNVNDESAMATLMAQTFNRFGSIDILVNAAGISDPAIDGVSELERFRRALAVNLEGVYLSCALAVPYMRKNDSGSIINISSINSQLGFPSNPGYVASKGGIGALTRALAVDYGVDNIRVNAIAPGYIHTAMTKRSYNNPVLNSERQARTVLQRWGEPSDMIGICIYLASQASAYMTGQELCVDGGWTIKGL